MLKSAGSQLRSWIMDRTIDLLGRPYYPGYVPFERSEPQIYRSQNASQYDSDITIVEDY